MKKLSILLSMAIIFQCISPVSCIYAEEITGEITEIEEEQNNDIENTEDPELSNIGEAMLFSEEETEAELASLGETTFDPMCPAVDYPKLYSNDTEYTDQNYTFVINDLSSTATITGYTGTSDIHIPSTVTNASTTYTVTAIDDSAFANMRDLTGTITIPNTVEQIGADAFYGCAKLTGDLYIPDSVSRIGRSAFGYCKGLSGELHLPQNNYFQLINPYVFSGCSHLSGTLTIPDRVMSIHQSAFDNCSGFSSLVLPTGLYDIGSYAFYMCKGFTGTLTIKGNLQNIGDYTFADCSGFTGIAIDNSETLPSGIKARHIINFGNYCFNDCTGFTGPLELPSAISLGDRAFAYCYGFSDELIINYVHYMGREVFRNCSGFTQVTNRSSWKIDLMELGSGTWISQNTGKEITELYTGTAIRSNYSDSAELLLKRYEKFRISNRFKVGNDQYTISSNYCVAYDGRKHYAVGVKDYKENNEVKGDKKKVYDVFVTVTKNGEIIDPSEYSLKTVNNKDASMKIENGSLSVRDKKKQPKYTIQFKHADKALKKEAKFWSFSFNIFPAKLTADNVKVSKVKRIRNRNVRFGKAVFTPSANGIKPVKLKYSKKSEKTDYTASLSYDNSENIQITGQNNYYGTAEIEGVNK